LTPVVPQASAPAVEGVGIVEAQAEPVEAATKAFHGLHRILFSTADEFYNCRHSFGIIAS
jgi:hypothetical protein